METVTIFCTKKGVGGPKDYSSLEVSRQFPDIGEPLLEIQSKSKCSEEPPSKATPARCITARLVVHKDDKKIVLADSKAQDGDWGGLHVFPAAVVVNITNLRRSPTGFFSQ